MNQDHILVDREGTAWSKADRFYWTTPKRESKWLLADIQRTYGPVRLYREVPAPVAHEGDPMSGVAHQDSPDGTRSWGGGPDA